MMVTSVIQVVRSEAESATATTGKTVTNTAANNCVPLLSCINWGKQPACIRARLQSCRWSFTYGTTAELQFITALSEGRGYGEARGEALFFSCKSAFLTHPACGIPPLLQAGEDCCQRMFRGQTY